MKSGRLLWLLCTPVLGEGRVPKRQSLAIVPGNPNPRPALSSEPCIAMQWACPLNLNTLESRLVISDHRRP